MSDNITQDMFPLYAQKIAQKMWSDRKNSKIMFLLIIPNRIPVNCVWIDPYNGMFSIKGHETDGFMILSQLEPGSLIVNQRYEGD